MNRISEGELRKEVAVRETLSQMIPIYEKLTQIRTDWISLMKKFIAEYEDLKKIDMTEVSNSQSNFERK